ncbi:MAG: hypothetical protein FWE05_13035 [Defluviitaleaceae bacterium]|nr:hypothetical protein [Defluviitaleaceae bacterium]
MKHLFIVNPISFAKESEMYSVIRDISAYFDTTKDVEHFVYVSRYPRDAVSVVKKCIHNANDAVRVYAVGGDGILFDCLNGMIKFPHAELAIIPYGTANDFMRSFGEDVTHIFRNIEKQVKADTITTDVIHIGSKFALSFCAAGIEAAAVLRYYEICRRYPHFARSHVKSIYVMTAFLALLDEYVTFQEYEITIDGINYDGQYSSINIANSACYGGNKTPAPMAHPADGFLDIILTISTNRWRLMNVLMDYTNGKYYKHPKIFKHVRGKAISVRSKAPLQLDTDGESYFDTSLDARIKPNAVKIVAPDGLDYIVRRTLV